MWPMLLDDDAGAMPRLSWALTVPRRPCKGRTRPSKTMIFGEKVMMILRSDGRSGRHAGPVAIAQQAEPAPADVQERLCGIADAARGSPPPPLYLATPPAVTAMNYRHAYHAGNFADVLKHTVLLALIEAMQAKPTPFCYIDTHAGSGNYPLDGFEARKTGEHKDGIARLHPAEKVPPLLQRWRASILGGDGNEQGLKHYPGSPLQVARLLRPDDSAQLCELHTEEAAKLRDLFRGNPQVHVHQRDGYEALKALLPPKEKRGLVLIDPPYEAQEAEYKLIEQALKSALLRWPTGIYAVWYPIKLRSQVQPFLRRLQHSGVEAHAARRTAGASGRFAAAPQRLGHGDPQRAMEPRRHLARTAARAGQPAVAGSPGRMETGLAAGRSRQPAEHAQPAARLATTAAAGPPLSSAFIRRLPTRSTTMRTRPAFLLIRLAAAGRPADAGRLRTRRRSTRPPAPRSPPRRSRWRNHPRTSAAAR